METEKQKIEKKRSNLARVPMLPGVYFFENDEEILYIGKAKNLRSRLLSYFMKDLTGKTKSMVQKATSISYITVNSELESLLLEAKLVRSHTPKYNIELRDDKHPLYIKITKEMFPRVITVRKSDTEKSLALYGPFPSSTNVKSVLRLLRRIFPYCDHALAKRPCLRSQIGLCNPCPSYIVSVKDEILIARLIQEYRANIRYVKGVLDGRIKTVKVLLHKSMIEYSKAESFEKAQNVKSQIEALEYITQPITKIDAYVKNPNFIEDIRNRELDELKELLARHNFFIDDVTRIECFDVAHIAGNQSTASMVTFIDGVAEKKLYRHFKIYQQKKSSDTDSLREVIKRRLKHISSWGMSDLVIVDGGKPQTSVFFDELKNKNIPVVGLAKRFETLVIPFEENGRKTYKEVRVPKGYALNFLKRIRDEAHRFARRYHHKLVQKELLNV